jgi:outer membrane protein OmpA-like peptidoglycan-associated protein/tetratricopeptide (TPR) repeat protein
MKTKFTFLLLTCFYLLAAGQTYLTYETITGKAKEAFEAGLQNIKAGNKEFALFSFEKAAKIAPTFINAHLQQAILYQKLSQWEKAEMAFARVVAIDRNYDNRVLYSLALVQQKLDKKTDAIRHFQAYMDSKNPNPVMVTKARQFIEALKTGIQKTAAAPFSKNQPQNMGANVNDREYSQYFPALTADGETLIFTRKLNTLMFFNEDFFWSKKVNGIWQKAEPIEDLNTEKNEGGQCVSADGQVMYFSACDRADGKGACDIYMTAFKNGVWETPINVEGLNTKMWEALPALSADKRTIYFTSSRTGSKGRDLWYSTLDANNQWVTPKNMGETINTSGDEQAPFIHPDGQTLYFASNGHGGLGGFDIFYTRKQSDGTWSIPENLGTPINTPNQERSLSVSLDGKYAFFSRSISDHGDDEKQAIFYCELEEKARPQLVTYVKATVRDAVTKQSLSSALKFIDVATGQTIQTGETDNSGVFLVTLNLGKKYALSVTKQGYSFYSQTFDLSNAAVTIDKPFVIEIELTSFAVSTNGVTTNRNFVLKNVHFATAQSEPLAESYMELDNLVQMLLQNPTLEIAIHGHTDNVGASNSNLALSERRAASIKNYLISKGIEAKRLSSKGFGATKPLTSNETDAGKAMNRRTEFVIVRY